MSMKKTKNSQLNVYTFGWERNIFKKIRQFFYRKKYASQRAKTGFCDWDLWDLDNFLINVIIDSVEAFAKNIYSSPYCVFSKYMDRKDLNENEKDDAIQREWKSILTEIVTHLKNFRDYEDIYKNEYEEEWLSYKGEDTPDDVEEKFSNRQLEIQEIRKEEFDKGMNLLKEHFDDLWW